MGNTISKIKVSGVTYDIIDESKLISINYSQLVTLRNNDELVPGDMYRITDYRATTVQDGTSVINNAFDIIVVATSPNTLSENAMAIRNSDEAQGGHYYDNSNLEAWELKYSLDNDTTKFAWADSTNGYGVIYYMKDEFNNEAPYDFKCIKFKPNKDVTELGISANTHYYTFSLIGGSAPTDHSLNGSCHDNKIGVYYNDGKKYISKNIFADTNSAVECSNNVLSDGCYDNLFGAHCTNNKFNAECYSNVIGEDCSFNKFGDSCNENILSGGSWNNSFGYDCFENVLSVNCEGNVFGTGCYANSIGGNSENNEFGIGCHDNVLVEDCCQNKFNINCGNNVLNISCYSNVFGDGCMKNVLSGGCLDNEFGIECRDNALGEDCCYNKFSISCENNALDTSCYSNVFGDNCIRNVLSSNCEGNVFEKGCMDNVLSGGCAHNMFETLCQDNALGDNSNDNNFGKNCEYNTLGDKCRRNTFNASCSGNTFSGACSDNKLGNLCKGNVFASGCSENTFGNNCNNIIFEKEYSWDNIIETNNQNITLTADRATSPQMQLKNVTIAQGTNVSDTVLTITHSLSNIIVPTKYQSTNSQIINL